MKPPDYKITYYEYLQTPEWRAKREKTLKHYYYQCCICGSKNKLNVHHKTYCNIFNEKIEDLTVLCQIHHNTFHIEKETSSIALKERELEVALMEDIRELSNQWLESELAKQEKEKTQKLIEYYKTHPDEIKAEMQRISFICSNYWDSYNKWLLKY